ncbi:MAG TPA: DNA polymerase/3'-5' exonuclease PolX, partial [Chloroflexota bacterium]|nr:DNA polymerase/3'-5' exonuclease PolX [Chloroflexota bacterium]
YYAWKRPEMSNQNAEVVDLLQGIGDLMELRGDESFKVRAYREAARQLDRITEDVATLAAEGRLTDVRGVGPSIAKTIAEYLETGTSRQLNALREQVPESLVELLGIRHFGPSRIVKVHRALGISSLDELEEAARDGRLAAVAGFGAKTVETLLTSIARFRRRRGHVARYVAESLAESMKHSLRQMASTPQVEVVGGMRRLCESVREIALLAAADDAGEVIDAFTRLTAIREHERDGTFEALGRTRERYAVRLTVVPPAQWAEGLVWFTAADAHREQLRALAAERGVASPAAGGDVWAGFIRNGRKATTEAAVYKLLGLPVIPSELREGRGEVEAAQAGKLPKLIEVSDVRGDLHVHTNWSDGRHSVFQMGERAGALGLDYIAIADHSPSLGVARGLTLERLEAQRREIAEADDALEGIRILSGVEVDIRHDGSLDYPDEVMGKFDFVTASIHSGFQQSEEQLTERVVKAMRSPHVDAIGHLTGRILGWREGLDLDVEKILHVAAETGTAMEINAWPNRLDLNEEHARRAKDLGVKLVINTDSHAADQLAYLHYGVEIARRAWVEKGDVLNTLPYTSIACWSKSTSTR